MQLRDLLLHARVPVVFYRVVGSSFEDLGDLGPTISKSPMRQIEQPLLVIAPLLLFDGGVEMVMPAFPALLADAACITQNIPGRFSAIVVHFCAP